MSNTVGFVGKLCDHVGETVTIYTTSGGQSGHGFTGVVLAVDECFVRLITCIGPAPGCALGSACSCNRGRNFGRINTVGSVVDIPIDRIAAVVHNAV
ncbi:MAG: hypothetical protein GX111_03305 [Clostridiales bacterium]|nr:hypothetical protein [Clostridiales bacterium]